MYKLVLLSFLIIFSAQAEETQDFDWQKTVQEKMSNPEIQDMLSSGFEINDVNSDGFISENEYGYLLKSIDIDFNMNDEQKAAKKSRMQEYFKQADKNGDSRLSKEEYFEVLQKETEYEAKERVKQMQELANKSPEEMMRDFNEKMEKAKAALEKFQDTSAEEMSDNIIGNISQGLAEENYFQMDKDKDGCVTADEYAEYMAVFSKNVAESNKDTMSDMPEADWREVYKDEKKAKENCLTKEEYIRNFNEMTDISDVED
ncbi:MAG: EF-hand domain-containing protein [Alphaproteobacteria bacterium]|nr:hypothetical protein [Alphaproteobacteria bacterium]MDY4690432.1 hypothetical protein [Alphaproteobacteria bacterium]